MVPVTFPKNNLRLNITATISELYFGGYCQRCNDVTNIVEGEDIFDPVETERLIAGIYDGSINERHLDERTYKKIAEHLTEGIFEGYGGDFTTEAFGVPDKEMLAALQENIYIFSGAKLHQFTKDIQALKLTENGRLIPWQEFKPKALDIHKEYNVNHLKTEYRMAVAQSRMASNWQGYQKTIDILPNLTYRTAGDGRVRPAHAKFDGITRPLNDPFWRKNFPPNDWGCRCDTDQSDELDEPVTKMTGRKLPEIDPMFQMNSGIDKYVFSPEHPYFQIEKKDRVLAAKNFNLPIPKPEI